MSVATAEMMMTVAMNFTPENVSSSTEHWRKINKSETINIILKSIKKTKQAYILLWY